MAKDMFQNDNTRPDSAKVAFIMTDGGSNNKEATFMQVQINNFILLCVTVSVLFLHRAATEARKYMEIVTMGLGNWIDSSELRAIASDSYSSNLIMVDRFSNLPDYVESVKAMLCNGKLIPSWSHQSLMVSFHRR